MTACVVTTACCPVTTVVVKEEVKEVKEVKEHKEAAEKKVVVNEKNFQSPETVIKNKAEQSNANTQTQTISTPGDENTVAAEQGQGVEQVNVNKNTVENNNVNMPVTIEDINTAFAWNGGQATNSGNNNDDSGNTVDVDVNLVPPKGG